MRIDAHQHFWNYDPTRDTWIDNSMSVLKRNFLPPELSAELNSCDIDGCIAVQADQSLKETEFLLALAAENEFIKGVVGWVDLQSSEIEKILCYYSQELSLKGIRHIVQAEADEFMLNENFQRGIATLSKFDLTYDILIYPRQLEVAIALVNKFPNQQFVIDHMAKPMIKDKVFVPWEKLINEIAKAPNVYCKVSGMVTEAEWHNWKEEDIKPYIDIVFQSFGIDRVMFGSDWPVCKLAGSYTTTVVLMEEYLKAFSTDDKMKFWGKNAIDIYNLNKGINT